MILSRFQVCKQADTVLAYILLGGGRQRINPPKQF